MFITLTLNLYSLKFLISKIYNFEFSRLQDHVLLNFLNQKLFV